MCLEVLGHVPGFDPPAKVMAGLFSSEPDWPLPLLYNVSYSVRPLSTAVLALMNETRLKVVRLSISNFPA